MVARCFSNRTVTSRFYVVSTPRPSLDGVGLYLRSRMFYQLSATPNVVLLPTMCLRSVVGGHINTLFLYRSDGLCHSIECQYLSPRWNTAG